MTVSQAAVKYYNEGGLNCAEAVLRGANEALSLGLDESAYKLLGAFGSGCGCGSMCGAVAACVAVIGSANITATAHGTHAAARAGRFVKAVRESCGSEQCAELSKLFRTPQTRCSETVTKITGILDELADELFK